MFVIPFHFKLIWQLNPDSRQQDAVVNCVFAIAAALRTPLLANPLPLLCCGDGDAFDGGDEGDGHRFDGGHSPSVHTADEYEWYGRVVASLGSGSTELEAIALYAKCHSLAMLSSHAHIILLPPMRYVWQLCTSIISPRIHRFVPSTVTPSACCSSSFVQGNPPDHN